MTFLRNLKVLAQSVDLFAVQNLQWIIGSWAGSAKEFP
jgi:hypothetical protein